MARHTQNCVARDSLTTSRGVRIQIVTVTMTELNGLFFTEFCEIATPLQN